MTSNPADTSAAAAVSTAMEQAAVTAVISTHNRSLELRKTLLALHAPASGVRRMVVVDNASDDPTAEMVEAAFPEVRLVRQAENHALRGYNIGFDCATTRYVWVMDDDATPAEGVLDAMTATLDQDPGLAAAAGNVLRSDGQSEWRPLPTPTFTTRWHNLIGCGFLIRKTVLNQLGGYCENYGLYYNDLDLALRILALGYRIAFRAEWIVHHRAAPSATRTGRKTAFMLRNFCFLVRAHYRGWRTVDLLLPHTLKFLPSCIRETGLSNALSVLRQGLVAAPGRGYLPAHTNSAARGFERQYGLTGLLKAALTGTPRLDALLNEPGEEPTVDLPPHPPRPSVFKRADVTFPIMALAEGCFWGERAMLMDTNAVTDTTLARARRAADEAIGCDCRKRLNDYRSPWPDYHRFLLATRFIPCGRRRFMAMACRAWPHQPTFSFLTPVYRPNLHELAECLRSIEQQIYDRWSCCFVDDGGGDREAIRMIEAFAARHPGRVALRVRGANLGIARTSQEAFSLATGDFVIPLDQDDRLMPDLLYEAARALNEDPSLDYLYADNDKLTPEGERMYYFFKPAWSPELLLSFNYLLHPSIMRRALVAEVGGYRADYEGSQDYDLYLRLTERTDRIRHMPRVLYSWRQSPRSVASDHEAKPYAFEAGVRAVQAALDRRGVQGVVSQTQDTWSGNYRIHLKAVDTPSVAVLWGSSAYVRAAAPAWVAAGVAPSNAIADEPNASPGRQLNRAIEDRAVEHVWLVCAPVMPPGQHALERLRGLLTLRGMAGVSPKLLLADGRVDHCGWAHRHGRFLPHFRNAGATEPGFGAYAMLLRNVSLLSPAVALFSVEALREVGGFDPIYATPHGVIWDMCLRLTNHGRRLATDGGIALTLPSPPFSKPFDPDSDAPDLARLRRRHDLRDGVCDPFYGFSHHEEPADFGVCRL